MLNIIVNSGHSFIKLRKSLVKKFLEKQKVNLFLPNNVNNILKEFSEKNLNIKKINIVDKKKNFFILIKNSYNLFKKISHKNNKNVYIVFGTYMNLIFGILSFFVASKKNIYVFTGLGSFFNSKNKLLIFILKKFLNLLIFKKKTIFIFYNYADRNFLVKKKYFYKTIIIPGSGIKIIKNENNKIIKKKIKFVFFSRLNYDKGILELINAIKIVNSRGFNKDYELFIYGLFDNNPTSVLKKDLLLLIKKINNCHFTEVDYKVSLKKVLGDKHVFVLPSYREGLPKTALEAMNFKNALLLSKIPGHLKLINKKKLNGLYFKKKNEIELSNKIIWMIKNKNYLKKFMINSYTNLSAFSEKKINKKFYEISK